MYGSEQALLPLVHANRMQATLNPQDRREGRDGQIGTRPSAAICRSGAPELGVVVSPRPPSEQVLRDLSRAPPETYGSALKAVLRIPTLTRTLTLTLTLTLKP